jgi:prepilin-type N-terminal cleavage/methylation domain-containing protein
MALWIRFKADRFPCKRNILELIQMRTPRKPTKYISGDNQAGFTIIEVLMAIIILSLGLLAYGATSGTLITKNTRSKQESIAITLAQDQLEELKASYLFDLTTNNQWINEQGVEAAAGVDHTVFNRIWTVNLAPGFPCNCYFDLNVVVSWNNDGPHQVELNTQVSQGTS